MKKSDYIGIAFPVLFALLVIFFPFNTAVTTGLFDGGELLKTQTVWTGFTTKGLDQFGNVTKYHPYIMGFLKFALLAMFGEMMKARIKNGSWKVDLFPVRVIVWGFFGLIMTVAFALFANGVQAMMGTPLWFGEPLMLSNSFGNRFIFCNFDILLDEYDFCIPDDAWTRMVQCRSCKTRICRRRRVSFRPQCPRLGIVYSEDDSLFLDSGAHGDISSSCGVPRVDGSAAERGARILPYDTCSQTFKIR